MVEALGSYFPRSQTVFFFLLIYWSLEDQRAVQTLKMNAETHRSRWPKQNLVFFCNTPQEQRLLSEAGLQALTIHQNQIISDQVFRPLDDVPISYDAVYNAKLARFKRHHLAAAVDRLLYVSYPCAIDMSPRAGRLYLKRMLDRSPRHHLANKTADGLPLPLSHEEVNRAYNQASVGLCLSPIEGAMYASTEYLLAGLPVVTTPSRGGRDVLFEDDFCLTVQPDCREVRDAVIALRDRKIPRQVIRNRVLKRLEAMRSQSQRIIENILEDSGNNCPISSFWPPPGGHGSIVGAPVRRHAATWANKKCNEVER